MTKLMVELDTETGQIRAVTKPSTPSNYAAGDTLLHSDDAAEASASTTYVKIKEINAPNGGMLRVKFDLKTSYGTYKAYGRIYRNGSAVGTEQSTNSTTGVTMSEDIAGWSSGDLLQLYVHGTSGANATASNLRIYADYEHTDWTTVS